MPLALLEPVTVIAFILGTIEPSLSPIAVLLIVEPLSLVHRAIEVLIASTAISHVV